MAEITRRKAELIAELNSARARIAGDAHAAARSLNVVDHVKHSITEHKTGWLTGAGLAGMFFAWWLRRPKKKVFSLLPPKSPPPAITTIQIPQKGAMGIVLSALFFAFNLFKPLLSALVSRKIAKMAARAKLF